METIKRLLLVSRPISWLNTAYPFAAGYLVSGGSNWALLVIGTFFFLIPYNLAMYGINDVFDYESDIKNPRKGGIEGMREQRQFHPTIMRAVGIICVPFIVALLLFGTLTSNLILIAVLFMVVAYSLKGLRFKEIPIVDSITSSSHFVGPLIYALSLTSFNSTAWVIVLAFFLWGMASHALGAVQDIIPDRQGKIASIATVLGAHRTIRFVAILYTTAAVLVMTLPGLAPLIGVAGLVYTANIVPYLTVTDETSAKVNRPWRRFIWLNLFVGFCVTMVLIVHFL